MVRPVALPQTPFTRVAGKIVEVEAVPPEMGRQRSVVMVLLTAMIAEKVADVSLMEAGPEGLLLVVDRIVMEVLVIVKGAGLVVEVAVLLLMLAAPMIEKKGVLVAVLPLMLAAPMIEKKGVLLWSLLKM